MARSFFRADRSAARLARWGVGLVGWGMVCFVTFPLSAAEPAVRAEAESQPEVPLEAWLERLGSEQFTEREAAAAAILAAGMKSLPLVEQGAQHADLEIRYRCEELQEQIVRADLRARLDAFAADPEGLKTHDLPHWDHFSEVLGNTSAARRLFISLYEHDPDLFLEYQLEGKQLGELVTRRAMQLQLRANQPGAVPFPEIVLLLFATGEEEVKLNDRALTTVLATCFQASFQKAVADAETKALLRKIVSRFISRCDGWSTQQGLHVATMLELPEGLELARKVIRAPMHSHMLTQAIPYITRQGTPDDIPLLKGLLENRTVVSNIQINNTRLQSQVRDCALAGLLQLLIRTDPDRLAGTELADHDLKKFGFARFEKLPLATFAAHTSGFANDDERNEAFRKWDVLQKQLAEKPPTTPAGQSVVPPKAPVALPSQQP